MININNKSKIIFHIDLNAFFATVASIINPTLKGKAFAIGRENSFKGVLSTASYEARKYGIGAAMPISQALKILPTLIIVNPNRKLYEEYHMKFITLLKEYSSIIEVASIDEAYIDMTEKSKVMHPLNIAKEIQDRLLKQYQLPCSIGIAPTLFLAKMASDLKKPLGITVIRKREIEEMIYDLSVKEIFGIGKKTWPKLIEKNIKTIRNFMDFKNKQLILGLIGERIYEYATNNILGNSSNIVDPERYAISDSISTSATYDNYLSSEEDILIELRNMTKQIHRKMVLSSYLTKTISITLRDKNFHTITRSKTIDYTKDLYEILDVVSDLLEDNYSGEDLRLVGVGLGNLLLENEIPLEYNLFTFESLTKKEEMINKIMNSFNEKYGDDFIKKCIKK